MSYVNHSGLKPNYRLRAIAREQLKGQWGIALLAGLIYTVIVSLISFIPFVGSVILLLVSGALALGLVVFFLSFPRNTKPDLALLFSGFQRFWPAFCLYFMVGLFTFLWSLLLIVPGIIAAFRYSQAFYIFHDNPDIGVMEAINRSKQMMMGNKGKLFMLLLSFFWWLLLCSITFGIAFLWVYPYMLTATANFYQDLKDASVPDGDTPAIGPAEPTID